jgi:hypothetical protein
MSVRQVWREASALFRGYPALWLPVLGAELLSFFLVRPEREVIHVLFRLLLPPSAPHDIRGLWATQSHVIVVELATITTAIRWIAYFAPIALFVTAFFFTVALARKVRRRETELLRSSLLRSSIQFVQLQYRAVFRLSFWVLVLYRLVSTSFALLLAFATRRYGVHLPSATVYALVVPVFCGIAYFVAPMAMEYIGPPNFPPLTEDSKRKGRDVAMLMVAASWFLRYCLPYFERFLVTKPLFKSSLALTTLGLTAALIAAIPYIVLFIALTLIVDGDVGDEFADDLISGDDPESLAAPS